MARVRSARSFAAAVLAAGLALAPAAGALAMTPGAEPDGRGDAVAAASAVMGLPAGVDDFTFASFDAIYELSRDAGRRSVLETTETLVAVFPDFDQNRGIRRAIPLDYDGHPTDLEILSVTDAAGEPRRFETAEDDAGEFLLVTIAGSDYVHGEQTYVIEYRQRNVTHVPDDAAIDEFYWDVNGTGWAQPFGRVSAELRMSDEVGRGFDGDVACYRGWSGSSTPCEELAVDESPPPVVTAAAAELGPYENLTIAAGFESGTFVPRDEAFTSSPAAVTSGVAGLVALITAVAAIVTRATRWRDHPGRGTVIAQYEPPADVSAMVAADLVGRPGKGVTATILERAVDGEVRIVETGRKSYAVEYTGEGAVPADAEARRILAALFGGNPARGALRSLKARDTALGKRLLAIRQSVTKHVVQSGLRRRPELGRRVLFALVALVATVLSVVFGIVALDDRMGGGWPFLCLILAIAAALATLVTVAGVRPLTERGRAIRDHLEGLRLYIRLAEADRLRVLQSPVGALRVERDGLSSASGPPDPVVVLKLNERLLPYAVLFGLEREWSRELAALYEQTGEAPGWYDGRSTFNASAFAAGVSSFSSTSSTSWSGSSSSSSSSGSSGGGSSGGGGGGGGGGGV
ncbi:DUF2207 domain-containing protein [Agromyces ramosus]|uniref:Membrane protein YgcG n=1 Tax=Agromyces ramosus TaxID=33879 RepID=A0ABU0RC42_9MICO|nr:DUF2207 domain-containing protein [Agromyces ramosus]MDQ0895621.1 putative membrane protein YgcG [Agromyces ramosus]